VTASARITFPERLITSEPKHGQVIKVETPTHIAGVMDFKSGAVGTITTSFDVWGGRLPRIEVYGSEGTLSAPDPNGFGGLVVIHHHDEDEWKEMPLTHGYLENARGIGVADMAQALLTGRKHRASGELACHVLDIMQSFLEASDTGKHVELSTTCERPAALKPGLAEGELGE
jgi:predicted dehydrogenase